MNEPSRPRRPVMVELPPGAPDGPSPDEAPPVPDDGAGAALTPAETAMPSRGPRPRRLAGWLIGLAAGLGMLALSIQTWDFVVALMGRYPPLGYAAAAIAGLIVVLLLAVALREALAIARLGRIDRIRHEAVLALEHEDLAAARQAVGRLEALYRQRDDLAWARARLRELAGDQLDAGDLIELAEIELLKRLDDMAIAEIEAAARRVALVTAAVPLAFADVAAALVVNLAMIRRISAIYGGRAGLWSSARLLRAVTTHLFATGAIAIGDDLVASLTGGNILSKVSRRFGEGVVNGALTARVGVAAMEVVRPLPFCRSARPGVSAIVRRALGGLFSSTGGRSGTA